MAFYISNDILTGRKRACRREANRPRKSNLMCQTGGWAKTKSSIIDLFERREYIAKSLNVTRETQNGGPATNNKSKKKKPKAKFNRDPSNIRKYRVIACISFILEEIYMGEIYKQRQPKF